MNDPETIKFAVGGGVILLTAVIVLRSARDPAAVPPVDAVLSSAVAPVSHEVTTRESRPRILTGEPASPEQRKPVPRRALRLVAGITTLAVAGAVGLIVIVRALIEMFQQIGG